MARIVDTAETARNSVTPALVAGSIGLLFGAVCAAAVAAPSPTRRNRISPFAATAAEETDSFVPVAEEEERDVAPQQEERRVRFAGSKAGVYRERPPVDPEVEALRARALFGDSAVVEVSEAVAPCGVLKRDIASGVDGRQPGQEAPYTLCDPTLGVYRVFDDDSSPAETVLDAAAVVRAFQSYIPWLQPEDVRLRWASLGFEGVGTRRLIVALHLRDRADLPDHVPLATRC